MDTSTPTTAIDSLSKHIQTLSSGNVEVAENT